MISPLAAAVDALAARIRTTPSGARSLAHICAVVPTAQAGRRLRRALAARFGALVPPLVKTPLGMMLDEDDPTLAGRTDELRALRDALGGKPEERLARAKQLSEIRTILAAGPLSFADVAERIATEMPDEAERWRELAGIETRYRELLAKRGKRDRIDAMKAFRPDFPAIEETLRFDDPVEIRSLATEKGEATPHALAGFAQITPCATPMDEATRIAEFFASVKPNEALPALSVVDPEIFPEIESAFKAKGLTIHNPSRTLLATSSLGHLVTQIVALLRTQSYAVFSAFIRGGDVRRWLGRELHLTDEELTAALIDLDNRQAEFLPEKIDDIAPKTSGTLRGIFEFVRVQFRKRGLRAMLAGIFKDLILDERDPAAREFAEAAETLNALIAECTDETEGMTTFDYELFELRLGEATYDLEPDEGDVILTDGWMELPFVETKELVIAGFREGCVPEATVGHPYLPDALRRRLGLPDNAAKEARDRAILALAVGTRASEDVHILFHAIDAKGDILKPSRLLFETDDDEDLVQRVKTFYGTRAGTREGSAPDLPAKWKLHLPVPPAMKTLEKISPTRLDGYLRCPFTYYLRDKGVLGDKRLDDRAEELASWEFGNLAHEALEQFGNAELRDSTDAAAIRAFLEERVDAQLVERFGTAIPAIVALQGESVKRRLAHFAEIQAARRAEGWRIVAVERKLEIVYDHTRFHGKCDRIDYNEATKSWCVIDYKTWDSAAKAHSFEEKRGGTKVWNSIQLPVYCAMLDMDTEPPFDTARIDHITSCYCVLGKTRDDVLFTEPMSGGYVPEAEALIRTLIPRIERGIFWPPTAAREWTYDYADWLQPTPEESVDEHWIADQKARLEEFENGGAE